MIIIIHDNNGITMPRPSLKDQRSGEILDAYLTCVARFGLEGATQERIATEAGVKRPILRHYLGNKDQMIPALTTFVVSRFAASTTVLQSALAEIETPADAVDVLFYEHPDNDPRLMLAWQALTAAVVKYPDMRDHLLESFERFLGVIEAALRRVSPSANEPTLRAVAQGIAAAYVNLDAMSPLNPPVLWKEDLKRTATILASQLEQQT